MNQLMKSYLSVLLSSARDQQKQIDRIELSLAAAIEALKATVRGFDTEYENQRSSPDRAPLVQGSEHRISLIENLIRQLNDSQE